MSKLLRFIIFFVLQLGVHFSDGQEEDIKLQTALSVDGSKIFLPVTDSSGKPLFTGLYTGPYFDLIGSPSNVTAQVGGTVQLPCRVKQIGEKMVSWIREKDSHILSVEDSTFISDNRFRVLRPEPGNEWNLHIKPVIKRDEGVYECQISSSPKMSHFMRLDVIVPIVEIDGRNKDLHAQGGGQVTMTCFVSKALKKPRFISWFRDGHELYSGKETDLLQVDHKVSDLGFQKYSSSISIKNVHQDHSGNYTCSPENLPSASIHLHVLKGETRLAAKTDDGIKTTNGASSSLLSSLSSLRSIRSFFILLSCLFL